MKLQGIEWRDFKLTSHDNIEFTQTCAWVGSDMLDECKQYLLPLRLPSHSEVVSDSWALRPSSTKRPILQANFSKAQGLIVKLSAYEGVGNSFGRILLDPEQAGLLVLVSYGVAGNPEGNRWEEIIFVHTGKVPLIFTIDYTSGERKQVIISDGEYEACPKLSGRLISVRDQAVKRWITEVSSAKA
jgi:hypothetical protein